MSNAGRPPVPTALKVLHGNPGKRPLNASEPKPAATPPARPENLTDRAVEEWDRMAPLLSRLRVLTEADGLALGLLCNDISELESVTATIRKTGYLIKTESSGAIKLNPLVALQSELTRRVSTGLREFGLTPSSRTKIHTVASEPSSPWAALKNA